ncbi:RNA polymerase-binding protein RbpA [Lysobacter korlensis]|uniref:RNA polymerase-binding protein RbpA n=1 Tax=Lysobacter korlensis TaxID=553636 RepID=A0ABV6RZY8_9GAMM
MKRPGARFITVRNAREGNDMADRSLRGMRLGAQSLQSEEGVEFSPRKRSVYRTPDGSTFEVVFAAEADVPETWESPKTGVEGRLVAADGELVQSDEAEAKTPRTHWDMLLERRTRAELEELLQERLEYLRARRGQHKIGA